MENLNKKRGRKPIDEPLGEISTNFPFSEPQIVIDTEFCRLIVHEHTWPNEIAAAMANTSKFSRAIRVGLLIKMENPRE